jgi:hypothetical protein
LVLATIKAARGVAVAFTTVALVAAFGAVISEANRRFRGQMLVLRRRFIRNPSPLVEEWISWSDERDLARKLRNVFLIVLIPSFLISSISIIVYKL